MSPDFGKAARSSHGANGGVDFGGKLVIDERTPLSSFKENNRSNNNNNIIGNVTIKQTPEGLPRIKTKKIDETQRSTFGWRDFCPGAVSVVVAFFLFSAANVVWKSGKAEEWYEQFRGHARYVGPATCFRDAKLSEEHCLPHFAILGASTSTGRLRAALKEHPMIDSDAKAVHFWNTPYGTRASGGEMCEGHQSERGAAMLKAYVDALCRKNQARRGEGQSRSHSTGTSYDKDKQKG